MNKITRSRFTKQEQHQITLANHMVVQKPYLPRPDTKFVIYKMLLKIGSKCFLITLINSFTIYNTIRSNEILRQ